MSLKVLLLGLIDITPMPGYDLMKVFDESMLFFWHATHTQIYNTLKELEKDGLVTGEVIQQTGVPAKKVFSITEKGKNAIGEWLIVEPEPPGFKHKFLIKLSFGAKLSDAALIKQLDRYGEKLRGKLAALMSEKKSVFMDFARDQREYVLWELTFENGMMYYRNELEWVELAKRRLNQNKEKSI
ncbi:MAG: PadR family transcriptional regulator [Clostridiales bacterium]|nr:PadR family transcriptional regulator [Clostridiales bacterium]